MTAPGRLSAESLSHDLNTVRIGRHIRVLDEIDSTNSYVLATTGRPEPLADGTAVFAECQTAGRGRLGRAWHVPRGAGLTFTVALHERLDRVPPTRLTLAAAVAVADGIAESTDVEPVLRWPNDVYVEDRKLAGILIESRSLIQHSQSCDKDVPRASAPAASRSQARGTIPNGPMGGATHMIALGIGVNCLQHPGHFPPDIRDRATSLDIESRHPVDRNAVARAILRQLDARLADPESTSDDELATAWRQHSADIGTHAVLRDANHTYTGRIIDIHPREGLLVQLDTGARRHFDAATTTRA